MRSNAILSLCLFAAVSAVKFAGVLAGDGPGLSPSRLLLVRQADGRVGGARAGRAS